MNVETCSGQTGAAIVTKDLSAIEVFPTPKVFNIYRDRVLRGKVASLFYRIHKQQPSSLILPSEVETKLNTMMTIVTSAIEQTVQNGTKKHELLIGRDRKTNQAIDIILTDTEPMQVAYIFGVWN